MSKSKKDQQLGPDNYQKLDNDPTDLISGKLTRIISSRLLDISLLDEEDKFEEFPEEHWQDIVTDSIQFIPDNSIEVSSARFWEEDWTDLEIDMKFSMLYQQVALTKFS